MIHQSGARHCADVAGAFSGDWYDGPISPAVLLTRPLWSRARMSHATRARLLWLLAGGAMAAAA